MDPVTRLGFVGCGLMGPGIAEVAARSGIDVRVAEATPDAVEAGRRLTASPDRLSSPMRRTDRLPHVRPETRGCR